MVHKMSNQFICCDKAKKYIHFAWVLFVLLCCLHAGDSPTKSKSFPPLYEIRKIQVSIDPNAPSIVRRAKDEICRYSDLLSGTTIGRDSAHSESVKIILRTGVDSHISAEGIDPSQNFALYEENGHQVVHGASPVSTLWAAYELLESWGVGFYLGGDYLPKLDPERKVALIERSFKPALAIRGNLPWYNFANSPTSWNPQDYRTFLEQMSKQKANFIGFHTYNHEPMAACFPKEGQMKFGGRFMQANTKIGRIWSPAPWGAWNGPFGTDQFFDRDNWGSEIAGDEPNNALAVKAQQQAVIDAFAYARHQLGMKTCLGFEVVGHATDPSSVSRFVEKLEHVLASYSLDFLCMWQPEALSVHHKDRKPETDISEEVRQNFDYLDREYHDLHEAERILSWVRLAYKTVKEKKPEVKLVISGWGGERYLKFSDYYQGLDKLIAKDVIFSSLDQIDPWHMDRQAEPYRRSQEGQIKVKKNAKSTFNTEPGNYVAGVYGQLQPDRQRWPIPWFESDGYRNCDQTAPQPNVLAFEDIIKDTIAKGCQGMIGIHWRTRNIQDVAGYFYRYCWQTSLKAEQYFKNYSRHLYGPEFADRLSQIHLQLESFGAAYVGSSGTTECAPAFWWFSPRFGFPTVTRLDELKKMRDELRAMAVALKDGPSTAPVELTDLANTIHWLILRAETGLQIWDDGRVRKDSPLAKRLREAEELFKKGEVDRAKQEALDIAQEVKKLNFNEALQALASTCRTRGELGMLITANQRYSRFYIEFVDRIRTLAGDQILPYKTPWTYGDLHNHFPVPAEIKIGEIANYDAVLLPLGSSGNCVVELSNLSDTLVKPVTLPLKLMGGAYHRATFSANVVGQWFWKISSDRKAIPNDLPWPNGILTVVP